MCSAAYSFRCFHLFPNKSHPKCVLITVFTFEFDSKLNGCLSILCNDIVYWSYDPAHRRWLHKTCTLHVSISSQPYKAPQVKRETSTALLLLSYHGTINLFYRDELMNMAFLWQQYFTNGSFPHVIFGHFDRIHVGNIFSILHLSRFRPRCWHAVPVSEYKYCSLLLEVHMMYEMAWHRNYIV